MPVPFRKLSHKILKASSKPTSSPASGAGRSLYKWLAGQKIEKFGAARVLASLFQPPVNAEELRTSAISGQNFADSSPSENLQRSLESRLLQRMGVFGSMEYVLTWKRWDMPSGPPICALRALGRRISDKDSIGWPTPQARDHFPAHKPEYIAKKKALGHGMSNLNDIVAGWATPSLPGGGRIPKGGMSMTGKTPDGKKRQVDLQWQARGWNTPRATDGSNGGPNQSGGALPCDAGKMASRGVLNPDLARWLMGFPDEWDVFAPMETRSSRSSRRSS